MTEFLTDDRIKGVRRLLIVNVVLAAILVLLALPLVTGNYKVYGSVVLLIGVAVGSSSGFALRAVRDRTEIARRLCLLTGILLVVASVPLMPIWIGMLTVVAGIGLLVVSLAPEREPE